ncbi:hypothetical protein F5141DRAFT_1065687 [Pisolithus sp. B1]|nr:hypothetical protein F5141DRAFT_1065687 [Pisolithus sp. B1]
MPRGKDEGVLRFSGHPDDLIWFLEDVRDLCMQASCFEGHEWARWSIFYLGIEEFECPAVCYSKHDLYNLVDKQKKLSWIEKDDLFLKGFNQEFQGEILRRLKWNNRREYADNPWPTCQVNQEAERLLEEGYRFKLREAHLARDQQSAQEAQYEAEMQESRAARMEEQSPGEGSRGQAVEVEGIEVAAAELSSSPLVEHQCEPSFNHLQIPPIELQDAEDELRANEQPINTEACATDVPKPTPEPRGDLCEVQEQVGCTEVEEIKPRVEVERPSKVVAQRKPPEVKIQRKTLKSVTWMIKEILPEFQITHSSSRLSGWTILLIYLQQGWTWSLGVETCMTSPSVVSQPAKRSGATILHVNDAHSLAPRTCSAAAEEIDASLSQKSENCLFEGYEVYKGKVEAPRSGGWSSILESTVISSTRKSTKEAALRVRTPKMLCKKKLYGVLDQVFKAMRLGIEPKQSPGPHWHLGQGLSFTLQIFMFFLECTKVFEESDEHETPSRLICLLWRVLSVFLEDTLWSGELLSRPLLRSGNPALSHWTLTLVRGLMFSWMLRESEEVAKRSPSLDIQSSKNPSKVKRREE